MGTDPRCSYCRSSSMTSRCECPAHVKQERGALSFFDNYKDAGSGEWVSSDEKDVLIENAIPVQIVDVMYEEEGKYGERYVLKLLLPDEESGAYEDERRMGFGAGPVESRDRMLQAMMEYLDDASAEPIWVRFTMVGRSCIIEAAEAPAPPKKRTTRSRAK